MTINQAYNSGFYLGYNCKDIEVPNIIKENKTYFTAFLVGKDEGLNERIKDCEYDRL